MSFKLTVPPSGSTIRYGHFDGSGDSLALAQLAKQAKPIVIITSSALDAQRLLEEIPFFAPELSTRLLPDWETLPYDTFSPHQDLISERLATLYQLMSGACDILIVPVTTALYRMPPREYLAAHTFFLKRGETLDLDLAPPTDDFGGLQPRHPGAFARRIQRARRPGRSVSHGQPAALPHRFAG